MCRMQSANTVLMVQPDSFGFDEQTARTNVFQHKPKSSELDIQAQAMDEFNSVVMMLQQHDINIIIAKNDDSQVIKPNAIFPNNWLSTWPDGKVYLYPMATASRRVERNMDSIALLEKSCVVSAISDISQSEAQEKFLESTGVLIFDHKNKIAYGCISSRCDEELFRKHTAELEYEPIIFHAYDRSGMPIYHTNILLGIQTSTAVVCSMLISNDSERETVITSLKNTNHDVIDITPSQMKDFCSNILELQNKHGEKFLIMSSTSREVFTQDEINRLSKDKQLLVCDIKTIENIGGGGVRCMLAEIFLPPKPNL
jgi:hypothetical protein